MTDTPGTPHLLTDVRFSVSRKGYDPDEVDNFLERVSGAVAQLQDKLRQATAAAEAAEARAAEASRNEARLQARVDELESGVAAPVVAVAPMREIDLSAEAEHASSVLVMAQRTADAAVNDARTTAAQMLTEAEQEAARILGAARAAADEELRDLDRTRRELAADNSALDAFLAEQRAVIAAGIARIQAVLDDPAALRVGTPPVSLERPVPERGPVAVDPAPAPEPRATAPAPAPEPTSFQPVLAESDWSPSTAESDGGPATAAVSSVDDEFLSDDEDDADAAMRRFFDADFDDRR